MLPSQQEEWYKPRQLLIIYLIRNADVLVIQKQGFQSFLGPFTWRKGSPDRWGNMWLVTPPIMKKWSI